MEISPAAMTILQSYPWPGNIRELANVLSYTATLLEGETIEASDLPDKLRKGNGAIPNQSGKKTPGFYEIVADFEQKLLVNEIDASNGNLSRLAQKLGMDRSHLYSKMKEYGIERSKR